MKKILLILPAILPLLVSSSCTEESSMYENTLDNRIYTKQENSNYGKHT